jgi:hypothetical protein
MTIERIHAEPDPREVLFELIDHARGALVLLQADEKVDLDGSGTVLSAERLLRAVLRKADALIALAEAAT